MCELLRYIPKEGDKLLNKRVGGWIAFAMLLLFAQCNATGTGSDICRIDNITWIVIAIMIAMSTVAISYILGVFFKNPKLTIWSKTEIGTIVVTIFIVILIVSTFFALCEFLPIGETDYYQQVYDYLDEWKNKGLSTAQTLVRESFQDQFEATVYWFVGWPIVGGCGASHTSHRLALSNEREMLLNYAMIFSMSMNLQKIVLLFIEKISLSYLLPISIVLRLFAPSKEAGNFLIALAIGFILVYPSAYMVFKIVDDAMKSDHAGTAPVINPDFDHEEGVLKPLNISDGNMASVDPQPEIDLIAKYLYYAIFMPNFVIVITSTFVISLYTALKEV